MPAVERSVGSEEPEVMGKVPKRGGATLLQRKRLVNERFMLTKIADAMGVYISCIYACPLVLQQSILQHKGHGDFALVKRNDRRHAPGRRLKPHHCVLVIMVCRIILAIADNIISSLWSRFEDYLDTLVSSPIAQRT